MGYITWFTSSTKWRPPCCSQRAIHRHGLKYLPGSEALHLATWDPCHLEYESATPNHLPNSSLPVIFPWISDHFPYPFVLTPEQRVVTKCLDHDCGLLTGLSDPRLLDAREWSLGSS